jgi:hypothetical protein
MMYQTWRICVLLWKGLRLRAGKSSQHAAVVKFMNQLQNLNLADVFTKSRGGARPPQMTRLLAHLDVFDNSKVFNNFLCDKEVDKTAKRMNLHLRSKNTIHTKVVPYSWQALAQLMLTCTTAVWYPVE